MRRVAPRRTTATPTIGRPAGTSIAVEVLAGRQQGGAGHHEPAVRRNRADFPGQLPKLEAAKDKIDKLEATLSQTIKDNTADLATVAQQVDRLEAARADLYKTRTLMLYRMRGCLSAEQRVKLQAAWEASRPKGNDPAVRR